MKTPPSSMYLGLLVVVLLGLLELRVRLSFLVCV
jgi:hypothetical protein